MGIGTITFRPPGAGRKAAPDPQFLLTDIEVEEVSHVHFPANNRPWILKHAGRENADGVIEMETTPSRVAEICQKLFHGLGALEGALEGRGELAKRLDVSDRARDMVFEYMADISNRLDALCELLYSTPGTPSQGSLDAAVGGELASIGQKFAMLAEGFGVTEPPAENAPETVAMSATQKAGRAMSSRRLDKLGESVVMVRDLARALHELFEDAGGDSEKMEGYRMEKGADALASALDDGLASVITAITESHTAIRGDIAGISATVEKAVETASTTASEVVAKSVRRPDHAPAAGSNQPAMERSVAPERVDTDPVLARVYAQVLESAG